MKLISVSRAFLMISSLIFLSLLAVQTVRTRYYYNNDLQITQEEIHETYKKEFDTVTSLQSLEIVAGGSGCRPGYHPVLKYNGFKKSTELCKCGDDIIQASCNSIDTEIVRIKKCSPLKLDISDFNFPLIENTAEEPLKSVKLCGKRTDVTKISWIEDTRLLRKDPLDTFYKFCSLSDTYKLGVIKQTQKCPSKKEDFQCSIEGQRKCETRFLIHCTGVSEECENSKKDQCAKDEIGCFSRGTNFCIKNTEQCPITNVMLIKGTTNVPEGYEVQNIQFPSDYKLVVQRSNFSQFYVSDFEMISNFINSNYEKFNKEVEGYPITTIKQFLSTNYLDSKLSEYEKSSQIKLYMYREQQKYQYYYSSMHTPVTSFDIKEYNDYISSTYKDIYQPRIICFLLLLGKVLFDIFNSIKECKKESDNDKSNRRSLIIVNVIFFFLEILILILILTVYKQNLLKKNDLIYNTRGRFDKYSNWQRASKVNNIGVLTIITISLFGVTKLIALALIIFNKFSDIYREKEKSKQEILPLSDQDHQQNQKQDSYVQLSETVSQ